MYTDNFNASTRNGTFGGFCLVLLLQINWPGLANTILIAAVGASTSFLVSFGLQYLGRKFLQHPKKEE
ncbi:MAG: hypothetical protein EOO03_05090 [Chitinophagaceae bacterium]|nr:MAG: hypothetical protein EOO03_05090 [Chitinophagaceae bacterium]